MLEFNNGVGFFYKYVCNMLLSGFFVYKYEFLCFLRKIILHPDMPFGFIIFVVAEITVCILPVRKMSATDRTHPVDHRLSANRTVTLVISFPGRFSV